MNQPAPSSLKVRLARVMTLPCGRLGSQGGAYLAMEISFKSAPAHLLPADAAGAGAITPRPPSLTSCFSLFSVQRSEGARPRRDGKRQLTLAAEETFLRGVPNASGGQEKGPPSKIRPCPVSCDCGILIFGNAQVHLPLKTTKHRPAEELVAGAESPL